MLKRKFIIIGVLIATLLFVMTSCGDKDNPYSGIKFDDYIKLGKYKGLPSIKMPVEISEKDIDQAIDAKLGESSEEHMVKKGSVKKDDIANIDFEGRVNGKKFEGGTSKGYDLKIGSNSFIQGFEKQLIGKKIGSTVNVKVTFPKNYGNDKLAGKKAVFKVKINSVKKVKKPKLTDAFVKKHSKKSKTVAEYKKEVKADLKTKRLQANKEQQKTVMWSQIVSSTKIKKDKKGREMYPEERLKSVDKEITDYYKKQAETQKLKLEEFVKQRMNADMKTFKKQKAEVAKNIVKDELIMYAIADKEGIELTDEAYNNFIKASYKKFGMSEKKFKEINNGKTLEEVNGKAMIRRQAMLSEVQNWIVKNAK